MLNLVLYQPDIPQNFGAMLRLSACMGCTIHVVEPCGFPMDDQKLRRAGMDYISKSRYVRHVNWNAFLDYRQIHPGRLLLLETDGSQSHTNYVYKTSDYIVLGSESAGTPQSLYKEMETVLKIPMRKGVRSLNVAMSAGILVAEACRQFDFAFDS